LAGLETLLEQGVIDRSDNVVVPITGSGFKDLATPDRLTSPVILIGPQIDELKRALEPPSSKEE
jgi:threonine synthase